MTILTKEIKKKIDEMSYEELLRKWRFAPSGDALFSGEVGGYYSKRMEKMREEVGPAEHTRASETIGWGV